MAARNNMMLSRRELGYLAGISDRNIYTYEMMGVRPRPAVIKKLAEALRVSAIYLVDDNVEDPLHSLEGKEAASNNGCHITKIMDILLTYIIAAFSDDRIEQSDKDILFDGLACKYYLSKRTAGNHIE